jgi:hypothetical protein
MKIHTKDEPAVSAVGDQDTTKEIADLKAWLKTIAAGPLSRDLANDLSKLLYGAWRHFRGSNEGGMQEDDLLDDGIEKPSWAPPILSFEIERHGGPAQGSAYAAIQVWHVNLESNEASCRVDRKRLVGRIDEPLDTLALAKEIADLICGGKSDKRLNWLSDVRVRLCMKDIIPETNKQTTSGRRRRFVKQLKDILAQKGWLYTLHGNQHIFDKAK